MASNHTANFGLNQWAATDPVLREDFNADNASIEEALAEMAAELEGKGNLYFECGSYVGTGEFTSANPNTLTFSKRPLFVLVACEDSTSIFPGLPCDLCQKAKTKPPGPAPFWRITGPGLAIPERGVYT